MDAELRSLEERLRRANAPAVDHWAPGRARDPVAAQLDEHFGWVPPELVAWFAWHDGLRPPSTPGEPRDGAMLIWWRQESLADALEYHRHLDDLVRGPRASPFDPQPEQWLPVLTSPETRSKMWVGQFGPPHEPLAVWRTDYAEPARRVAGSLSELVSVWSEALDRGMYYEAGVRWRVRDLDAYLPWFEPHKDVF